MYYFANKYKKYDNGGGTSAGVGATPTGLRTGLGIAQGVDDILEGMTPANAYGRKPMGLTIGSTALKGAELGSALGPIGAGVGAALGAGAGFLQARKARTMEESQKFEENRTYMGTQRDRSQAALANDPTLATGVVGSQYYAAGGPLSRNYLARTTRADGGSLSVLSNDAVQINGPDHEQGGVDLPGQNAEVEGGETMQNNFVFSKRLGFAQEHARLQRAIGKIEDKKVMTPERKNSIDRMNERSDKLQLAQEYFKHTLQHFGHPLEEEQP